jgi:hypothetical protein
MNRALRIHAYGGADAISIDPSDLPTAVAHAANAIERNKTGMAAANLSSSSYK